MRGFLIKRRQTLVNTNSCAAKHLVKNGPSIYRFRDTLFKIKSVACIQAPFFRVETKASLEPVGAQPPQLGQRDGDQPRWDGELPRQEEGEAETIE